MEKSPKAGKHNLRSVDIPISLDRNKLTKRKNDHELKKSSKDEKIDLESSDVKCNQIIKPIKFEKSQVKFEKPLIKEEILNPSDEELLLSLYHGATCKGNINVCDFNIIGSTCEKTKSLLEHILICKSRNDCPEPSCKHSRSLIDHCTSCDIANCSLCTPVRKKIKPHKYT